MGREKTEHRGVEGVKMVCKKSEITREEEKEEGKEKLSRLYGSYGKHQSSADSILHPNKNR